MNLEEYKSLENSIANYVRLTLGGVGLSDVKSPEGYRNMVGLFKIDWRSRDGVVVLNCKVKEYAEQFADLLLRRYGPDLQKSATEIPGCHMIQIESEGKAIYPPLPLRLLSKRGNTAQANHMNKQNGQDLQRFTESAAVTPEERDLVASVLECKNPCTLIIMPNIDGYGVNRPWIANDMTYVLSGIKNYEEWASQDMFKGWTQEDDMTPTQDYKDFIRRLWNLQTEGPEAALHEYSYRAKLMSPDRTKKEYCVHASMHTIMRREERFVLRRVEHLFQPRTV